MSISTALTDSSSKASSLPSSVAISSRPSIARETSQSITAARFDYRYHDEDLSRAT